MADVADALGVEAQAFAAAFDSDAVKVRTQADFQMAHELGIRGYPSVVLKDDGGLAALTIGYRPLEALAPHLETWLEA